MPSNLRALDQQPLEIKVTFIGRKNSGKSTLINALLKDKYAPVGIGGSTLSVNSFRIFHPSHPFPIAKVKMEDQDNDVSMTSPTTSTFVPENVVSLQSILPYNVRTARETFQLISDHQRSMHPNSNDIQEFAFDVELQESLCDMRSDTVLVLVDIPGIQSNDSESKYLNYLRSNSDSFDCVVFVLDVLQDIDEQASLLKLVKTCLSAQSIEVPVIVTCNKVDDMNNLEIIPILTKVRAVVERERLKSYIPLSADLAFVYRAVSGFTVNFEMFQLLDVTLIDKIGYNEFARSKWMGSTPAEKCKMAFDTVSNAWNYDKHLTSTNFPNFLALLSQSIGGDQTQQALIKKQLNVALNHVKILSNSTVANITKIISIHEQIRVTNWSYKIQFWNTYRKYVEDSIKSYKHDMDFRIFYLAVSQLIEFDALLTKVGANGIDHQMVMNELMSLVRLQINVLLKHAYAWPIGSEYSGSDNALSSTGSLYYDDGTNQWLQINILNGVGFKLFGKKEHPPRDSALHWIHVGPETWKNKYTNETKTSVSNPVSKKCVWYDLSLKDYKTAIDSILLMSYHAAFCSNFGPEKIRMDSFLRRFEVLQLGVCPVNFHTNTGFSPFGSNQLNNCISMFRGISGTYGDDGIFVPNNKDLYAMFVHFKMPSQLSNPDHWGHLAWMVCKFMDSKHA